MAEYIEREAFIRKLEFAEKKAGKFVTAEFGINCASRCERFGYWEDNRIPVWFSENDFCSYGAKMDGKDGEGK